MRRASFLPLIVVAVTACGGGTSSGSAPASAAQPVTAVAATTTIADPSPAFGLDPVVTRTVADDPLADPRLAVNSADAMWCMTRWDRPENAAARKVIADHPVDRAYAFRLSDDEAGMAIDEKLDAGACALTFAHDIDQENVEVVWFAERLPSGRFREVSELPGPPFSYFDDGNAAVTASGTLQPVGQ